MIYFVPEAQTEYSKLGLPANEYSTGYFASRAAAMGAVAAEVVMATFYNFHPDLVRAAVPACWDLADADAWLDARRRAADAALQRMLGDASRSGDVETAAALARRAAEACRPEGRPLCAGHLSLEWPEPAHLQLWHAITVLREHRGDGHISVLVHAEVSPIEALVLHDASGMVPTGVLQSTRSWSDDEWAAGLEQLRDRGWVDADGALTEVGRDQREDIERETDRLAVAPWRALDEDACRRLRGLVRPLSKTIVTAGGLPGGRPR
jgi:hypothetical protein